MPSITPSYLYTLIALIAVCSLLVFSFMAYADAIRTSLEVKQLKNLMSHVAAKSTELLTLTLTTNATAEAFIQMPEVLGNKHYWLQFHNDSLKAWLQGGFGDMPTEDADLCIYLPKEASAQGYYIGGYGAAYLKCHVDAGVPQILLTSSS